jgi:antitoxin component HigA of HigAB toxin-antitoxin module
MENKESKVTLRLDLKKIVSTYNYNNPDKEKMTIKSLSEYLGITAVTLDNYRRQLPENINYIQKIMDKTGLKYNDIVIKVKE